MSNIKVSVIVPVYNAEKYLKQCLDSIITQTLTDIEIICVDDGSTDKSLEILKLYEKNDTRIKVIQQNNQYAGVARNNGLKIATGEWVTFIDSDDFCEIDGLEKLYSIAKENSLDFIKCSSYVLNETTHEYEKQEWYLNKIAEKIFNKITFFDEYPDILYGICDTPWSGLYKMSFIKNNNIHFPNFHCVNDHSFFVECLLKAKRIMVKDVYFVHHRIERDGSLIYTKHYYFDDQIKNYERVKNIVKDINNPKYAIYSLRREFSHVFYWYKKLIIRNINLVNINNIMIEFCKNYDISDVGEEYLRRNPYFNIYNDLKNKEVIELCKTKVDNPKFSIIIPVYNTVKYLPKCIESVLNQTLKEFEIICIDDNSNDGSYELLLDYAKADKRIIVEKNKQKGVSYARYQGCNLATAPYVQFLDSDDWLAKDALESIYEYQQQNDSEVCSFEYYNYDDKTKNITSITSGINNELLPNKKVFNYNDCKESIFQLSTTTFWTKCFQKDFILKFMKIGFGINGTEDVPVTMYLIIFAKKITHLSKPLYYYRQNRTNSLESAKDMYPLNFYNGYKRFYELVKQLPFFEDIKISYMNRALSGCRYALLSKKTGEGYYKTYKFLKETGFKELGVLGYSENCYYNKNDYNLLKYIVDFEYIFNREDLLLLTNDKTNTEIKGKILDKYKFKYRLDKARRDVEVQVVFDQRNINVKPYVSVIMPVYNTALYLRSCLDSLKYQTLQNIEVICVNDGSNDDSLHILKRYAKDDKRFVIVTEINSGQSVARNTGVKFAKGEYLYFCDSDDMLKDIALEKLYKKAEKENLEMVFFNTDVFFQNKEFINVDKLKYYERKNNYEGSWTGITLMKSMLDNNEYLVSPCLNIINHEFFIKNKLWFVEGIVHEDNAYTFKAMYSAKRVGFLDDKLYIHRIRKNSTTTSVKSFANVYGFFYSAIEIINFSKEQNLLQENLKLFENILNKLLDNALKIYNNLSNSDKNIQSIMTVYEQILFKKLVLDHQQGNKNKIISENKNPVKQETQVKTDLIKMEQELKKYKKQIEDVKNGYSFRIGRVITYLPRKIRGGIKCYKEHGAKYTVKRICQKLKIIK